MLRKKQEGFTLIELIMVIVILGILAATALPKFADMGADARYSTLKAAQGAFKSAAAIAHAKLLVDSTTTTIEGTGVTYVNEYPNRLTIGNLAGIDSTYSYATGTGVLSISGAAASCSFTYVEATSGAAPTYTGFPASSTSC